MEIKPENLIIKQGLDNQDLLLLWTEWEWVIACFTLGIFATLSHILLGIGVQMIMFYLFLKFRSDERGHKSHVLWRFNLWKTKKAFRWAPPAHATRFDN